MEESTVVTTLNLNKVCRVCFVEAEQMHSIFTELDHEDSLEDEPSFVYELLMNISSMRILAEDGLPTMICLNCTELAHTCFKFQQQCNRSQDILETYLSQLYDAANADVNRECGEQEVERCPEGMLLSDERPEEETDMHESSDKVEAFENAPHKDISEVACANGDMDLLKNDESNHSLCPNLTESEPKSIPLESEREDVMLDAAKVAATEDNKKLRHRLALKRLQTTISLGGKLDVMKKRRTRRLYADDNVYACDLCEKTYKHSSSLKIHMRTHNHERPYICTKCGKDFKQYASLTYHMRSHTGEQPYSCKICGKRYRQSGTLTAHMRIHTGQRPFLCSVCGRGFRQAPDLGYHMRTHTKEKPYMCSICGKTMTMQCHLVQHMRTHTGERPFKCVECEKAFPSSTRLKRHAIIHTGLKPFSCEVCDKSFNRMSSLRVHAKIHTDDRPHVCSVCGKGFIQAHSLRGHMFRHTGENFEIGI